jgi:hypothetical protein
MEQQILGFFEASDFLEHEVLRPLSHIRPGWELFVDPTTGRYKDEEGTFAWLFNHLIKRISKSTPPDKYHDSEDRLAEHVQTSLNWKMSKHRGIWRNAAGHRLAPNDYLVTLEQGGFKIDGIEDLIAAASGRVHAALQYGQRHFDDMERGHQVILAGVLAAILYHWDPIEPEIRKIEV